MRTKRAALVDASMSSAPASTAGCCATIPTLRPSSRAKPTMMFAAHPGCSSRNSPSIDDPSDDARACRTAVSASSGTTCRATRPSGRPDRRSRPRGGSARLFCGRCASNRRAAVQCLRLVVCREVRDAAARRVRRRAAEALGIDVLVGHGLHDVRARDEHVARALDHDREVGDRRRVHGSAGARAEDHRDLRHDARRQRVAQEDVGVAAERDDALLDPRSAGIVEPDDRRADLHREVHHLADLLGVRLGQRSAEDGEVLREDEHQAAVDRCRGP